MPKPILTDAKRKRLRRILKRKLRIRDGRSKQSIYREVATQFGINPATVYYYEVSERKNRRTANKVKNEIKRRQPESPRRRSSRGGRRSASSLGRSEIQKRIRQEQEALLDAQRNLKRSQGEIKLRQKRLKAFKGVLREWERNMAGINRALSKLDGVKAPR